MYQEAVERWVLRLQDRDDVAPSEDVEKAAKIASQWPKPHRCRAAADAVIQITEDGWKALDFYNTQTDRFGTYELRNCVCGSTLMVITEIHDLKEE